VHTLTSTPEINKSEERKLQWNRTEQKNKTKKVKKNLKKGERETSEKGWLYKLIML
jgi:hypothetical protein